MSWKTDDIEPHDIHEETSDIELDDETVEDVLARCHYTLTRAISIQQPMWLRSEAAHLISDIHHLISFHRVH